jgi:hypothetical protein
VGAGNAGIQVGGFFRERPSVGFGGTSDVSTAGMVGVLVVLR